MSCGARLADELRQKGYRVTPQRAVILETVAHMRGHHSVQEVFAKAESSLPGLNVATVYRTLDMLHRAGMVEILSTTANITCFSLRDPEHPHYHLICRNCDAMQEIEPVLFDELAETLHKTHGFSLDHRHLTFSGLCKDCQTEAVTFKPS
jgi:Fur family ferric uptake transcriptional regulator